MERICRGKILRFLFFIYFYKVNIILKEERERIVLFRINIKRFYLRKLRNNESYYFSINDSGFIYKINNIDILYGDEEFWCNL